MRRVLRLFIHFCFSAPIRPQFSFVRASIRRAGLFPSSADSAAVAKYYLFLGPVRSLLNGPFAHSAFGLCCARLAHSARSRFFDLFGFLYKLWSSFITRLPPEARGVFSRPGFSKCEFGLFLSRLGIRRRPIRTAVVSPRPIRSYGVNLYSGRRAGLGLAANGC